METFSSFGALRESGGKHRALKEIADILEGDIPGHTGGLFSFRKVIADKRLSEGTISCRGGLYHQESAVCDKIGEELADRGFEVEYEGKSGLIARSPSRGVHISVSRDKCNEERCCGGAYTVLVKNTSS
jgi:hypothetical protein